MSNPQVQPRTQSDPAVTFVAVTKSDSTVLPLTRALYVGGAGNVAVVDGAGSDAVTFTGVTAGSILPIRVRKVMSTNTTATSIVALY
jgi:hypothetical protein